LKAYSGSRVDELVKPSLNNGDCLGCGGLSSSRGRWLRIRVGDKAAEPTAIYEELAVQYKAIGGSGQRRTPPACVRLGYEREVEDDDADKRARGVS
jgi:hypothetical protein